MIFENKEQILYGNRFNGTKGNGYQPIKKEQTNEEWFCQLSTEEKAKWLYYQSNGETKEDWLRWLKQLHKPIS